MRALPSLPRCRRQPPGWPSGEQLPPRCREPAKAAAISKGLAQQSGRGAAGRGALSVIRGDAHKSSASGAKRTYSARHRSHLFSPPALRERGHRGFPRGLVAVCRAANVAVVSARHQAPTLSTRSSRRIRAQKGECASRVANRPPCYTLALSPGAKWPICGWYFTSSAAFLRDHAS